MSNDKVFTIKEGVTVTDEVVSIIAGLSATEVEGAVSLGGDLMPELISKAGAGKLSKGVRILRSEDDSVMVRLAVNIGYGYDIPKVCKAIQEKVKSGIESMTGIAVKEVDIKVASVAIAE
ncbi:MAG: Asp23/Gls24 family envelope stress response protein [Lachnospiraceae bacterium]|nr:Asp23/Gls24 family envelope stress response protein [Lachnospiraceae bacterium]